MGRTMRPGRAWLSLAYLSLGGRAGSCGPFLGLSSAGLVALALASCEDSSFSESPGDSSMLDANGGRGSSPNDARIDRPPSDAFELDAPGGASGDALSDDSNADPPDGGPRVAASSDARPPMDAANDV